MADGISKPEVLEKEDFVYHFSRMIYINSQKRKIFSHEAVSDNDVKWLIEKISEASNPNEWQFYFNDIPSDELKHDLLIEIAPNHVSE